MQSVMDSAVKEAAAFLAGLILAGIGVLSFIRLIHFSWILIIILIAGYMLHSGSTLNTGNL